MLQARAVWVQQCAHLCVVCISQHLLCLVAATAAAQQAHADACCLSRHCVVHVQHVLQVLENLLIASAQRSKTCGAVFFLVGEFAKFGEF
jgi:hypothetical protein